jgi:hypothetical protein
MTKLATVEVMLPRSAERKIDDLFVFDARCVDVATRQEILRLMPQVVHLRRAWSAHFLQHGCMACAKADSTVMIAARLRRRGATWAEIYEITGAPARTLAERKLFGNAVRRKLSQLDVPARTKSLNRYGAGGLCARCYLRLRRELAKTLRDMHQGRNADEEILSLTRRFDVAQWLLGDG